MTSDFAKGWLAAMAAICTYCDFEDCTEVSMVRDYAFYTRPADGPFEPIQLQED